MYVLFTIHMTYTQFIYDICNIYSMVVPPNPSGGEMQHVELVMDIQNNNKSITQE
jgi:hypothetical protein